MYILFYFLIFYETNQTNQRDEYVSAFTIIISRRASYYSNGGSNEPTERDDSAL